MPTAGEAPIVSTGPRVGEVLKRAVVDEDEGKGWGGPSLAESTGGLEASGGGDI